MLAEKVLALAAVSWFLYNIVSIKKKHERLNLYSFENFACR